MVGATRLGRTAQKGDSLVKAGHPGTPEEASTAAGGEEGSAWGLSGADSHVIRARGPRLGLEVSSGQMRSPQRGLSSGEQPRVRAASGLEAIQGTAGLGARVQAQAAETALRAGLTTGGGATSSSLQL